MNYLVIINASGKTAHLNNEHINSMAGVIQAYAEEKNIATEKILFLTAPTLSVRNVVDPIARILNVKPLENEALWGGDGHVTNQARFHDVVQNGSTAEMKVVFTNGEYPTRFPGYYGATHGFSTNVEGAMEPFDVVFINVKEKTWTKSSVLATATAQ